MLCMVERPTIVVAYLRCKEGQGIDTTPLLEEGVQNCQRQLWAIPVPELAELSVVKPLGCQTYSRVGCLADLRRSCLTTTSH